MATNLEHNALAAPQTLSVTSTGFGPGKAIPREFSAYGEDVSPPLKLAGLPPDAQALAIVMDDPDAPGGVFTHWTAWDIQNVQEIPRAADIKKLKGTQGKNGAGTTRYFGPKPPSGMHHYRFRVFALKEKVGLPHGAPVEDVWKALDGKVRAWGELVGTYTKN
jgi:Raf kinase inhibitor-like YbhB/YbcL family protein